MTTIKNTYPTHGEALEAISKYGTYQDAANHFGLAVTSFRNWLRREKIEEKAKKCRDAATSAKKPKVKPGPLPVKPADPDEELADDVHVFLKKQKKNARLNIYDLSDMLDVQPSRLRAALAGLREKGFRVPDEEEDSGNIALQRVLPDDQAKLHRSLLEGQELRIGLVSDTHLCSKHCALPELELAYDVFEREGITEVWHPGDLVAGVGIFRTQAAEINQHTYDSQVEYAQEFYPKRDGITTRLISGNHDLEGDFGRIGGDPVQAVSNVREDMEYLGPYSAHIELPGGSFAHLLHGSGGMGYAYSYKAQKLVDGYEAGHKPAILCPGHWHVAGWLMQRNVNVVFPGCTEWTSSYLRRKGLSPAVGFFILNITIGDDGSVVKFMPEWNQFFEGRVAAR